MSISKIKNVIGKVVILTYFLLPTVYYYYYFSYLNDDYSYFSALIFTILNLILLYGLFLMLDEVKIKFLKLLFLLFLFISYISEIIFLYLYEDFIGMNDLQSIYNTNTAEAAGFIKGLWLPFVSVFISFILISVLIFKTRFVKPGKRPVKVIAFSLFLFVLSTLIATFYGKILEPDKEAPYYHSIKKNLFKRYPVNFYFRTSQLMGNFIEMSAYQKDRDNFRFNAINIDTTDTNSPRVHVFIIGESQRYDIFYKELELNGRRYKMFNKDNITILSKYFATANNTVQCVPLMLTRADIDHEDRKYKEASLLRLYKEAGYKIYWISNQDIFFGSPVAYYLDDVDEFYKLYNNNIHDNRDDVVLDVFNKVLNKDNERKVIVINIRGNHNYHNYPSEFKLYTPDLNDRNVMTLKRNREYFINSYRNMANYQLHLFNTIIEKTDSLDCVSTVYYASDHGESLFDPPYYYWGHGSIKVPIEQVHIFSFVWLSDEYERLYPVKKKNIKRNSLKVINADCLFYTLPDIAGISFPLMNKKSSLASCEFEQKDDICFLGGNGEIHKLEKKYVELIDK